MKNIIKSAGFALAAMVMGFAVSAQALDIAYDGFCDGVRVNVLANGVAYGTETGCISGPVVGTKGVVDNQGQALTLAENHVANAVFVIRFDIPGPSTYRMVLSCSQEPGQLPQLLE